MKIKGDITLEDFVFIIFQEVFHVMGLDAILIESLYEGKRRHL
jgi:hypothetical protein